MHNEMKVVIQQSADMFYPQQPPFSPSQPYPEYQFEHLSQEENSVYAGVRELFLSLGYDSARFGTPDWNPLGTLIKPGQKVIIKPNWVNHRNPVSENIDSLITHTSVIRAVADYALIALGGTGMLIIGDSPVQMARWDKLIQNSKSDLLFDFYRSKGVQNLTIKDFRKEISIREKGVVKKRIIRDDTEFVEINFREKSFLHEIRHDFRKFRVTNYDIDKMLHYHNLSDHIYLIDRDVLSADAVIYLPKLKTHQKAGLTGAMKNSVGINVQKDCLVHHRKGPLSRGGDAYLHYNLFKSWLEDAYEHYDKAVSESAQKRWKRIIWFLGAAAKYTQRDPYFEGSWYGNNSLWRMILDLATLLFYASPDGELMTTPQRRIFYLVDAVACGEGAGPLKPESLHLGCLFAGTNPVVLDLAGAKLMGFDYRKIAFLSNALKNNILDTREEIMGEPIISFNNSSLTLDSLQPLARFKASEGWINHIELE